MKLPRIWLIVLPVLCMALAFAPDAQARLEIETGSISAPSAQPHSVYFATSGLANGVSITITGSYTNKRDHTVPFKRSFASPGPSQSIKVPSGSIVTLIDAFPDQYILGNTIYTLIDVTPPSPFVVGLSRDSTTVVGTYTSCSQLIITSQPISATVTVGDSVSFSVSLVDDSSASYQWYKDGLEISGATGSTYTIAAAGLDDAGTYYVVVSNSCETVQSNPAELTVAKKSQTIDFPPPPSPAVYNSSFTVNPTATSGLPVTLQASGGCQIAGSLVTMTSGSLDCTLTASQPGDDIYLPAPDVQRVVAAARASQTINFPSPLSPAVFNTSFTVNPTATSGLPVTLQASGGCQIYGNLVTMTSGSLDCTLTASQPGDEGHLPALDVQRVVAAARASQIIDFPPPPTQAVYSTTFTVSAPTATSGLAVALQASGGCQIAGNLVTMTSGSLDCTLTASQPGDENYLPALDVQHVVASVKVNQTIDFPPPPSFAFEGFSFAVYPTADSGLAVIMTASGSCTVSGYAVTIIQSPGICTLTASQPGDENYSQAEPVVHTLQTVHSADNIALPIIFLH
jgi:hypothetical protein